MAGCVARERLGLGDPRPPRELGARVTAWAHRTGRLASDVGARLSVPRVARPLPSLLTPEQAGDVLDGLAVDAADGHPVALRDRAIAELLYASGIRVAQLCSLDLDDVDESRRALRVLGKGGEERTVPYGTPAEVALRDWRDRGRPHLLSQASGSALFIGVRGGRLTLGWPAAPCTPPSHENRTLPISPPRAAALGSHPPTRGRRGPEVGSGAARARLGRDYSALHARLDRAAAAGVHAGASPRLNGSRCPGRPGEQTHRRRSEQAERVDVALHRPYYPVQARRGRTCTVCSTRWRRCR